MNRINLPLAALLMTAALAGCNNAKSPDAVANDVANAQQKSAEKVADAQESAAKDNAKAEDKVDDKTKTLTDTEAPGAYDVAIAKADGDHKIATEKCKAMSGDAQKACKDQADAKHDMAVANAKANLAAKKS